MANRAPLRVIISRPRKKNWFSLVVFISNLVILAFATLVVIGAQVVTSDLKARTRALETMNTTLEIELHNIQKDLRLIKASPMMSPNPFEIPNPKKK